MKNSPVVELSLCVCCGVCTECCPAVFVLNPAGYIEVADLPVYSGLGVAEAMKNCPADCISWNDA